MKARNVRYLAPVLTVIFAACGNSSPTGPSGVQVGGTWTGTATLTAVIGGECLGVLYSALIGNSSPYAISIIQTGSNLAISDAGGCSYVGTAEASGFALNSTICTVPVQRNLPCQIADGGGMRDVAFVPENLSGTITGNSMTMLVKETSNVLVAGTNNVVGTLTVTLTVQAKR